MQWCWAINPQGVLRKILTHESVFCYESAKNLRWVKPLILLVLFATRQDLFLSAENINFPSFRSGQPFNILRPCQSPNIVTFWGLESQNLGVCMNLLRRSHSTRFGGHSIVSYIHCARWRGAIALTCCRTFQSTECRRARFVIKCHIFGGPSDLQGLEACRSDTNNTLPFVPNPEFHRAHCRKFWRHLL